MFAGLPVPVALCAGPTPSPAAIGRAMGACPQGLIHTCPHLLVHNLNCNTQALQFELSTGKCGQVWIRPCGQTPITCPMAEGRG